MDFPTPKQAVADCNGDDADIEAQNEKPTTSVPSTPASRAEDDDELPLSRQQTKEDSGIARAVELVLTKTRSNHPEPGPPPDGGKAAWLQVACAHVTIFNTWGFLNSFGVFQTFYVTTLGHPPSDISWVGSVQIFLLFFVGTFSGRASDAGYFKLLQCSGVFLQILGIFMVSLSHKYWQLFLAQGLCIGLGNGIMFTPALSVLSAYFSRNRAVAMGCAAIATATGAVFFPILVQQLLPRIGFGWTVRIIAFFMLTTMIFPLIYTKSRLPPRKSGPIVEWSAFREPAYSIYAFGITMICWGIYFPYYYIAIFSETKLGLSQTSAFYLLIILNASATPCRVIPAYFADRFYGPLNVMIPFSLFTAITALSWIAIDSRGGLTAFAVAYGIITSGTLTLFPQVIVSLTKDQSHIGTRYGDGVYDSEFCEFDGPAHLRRADHKDGWRFSGRAVFLGVCAGAGVCESDRDEIRSRRDSVEG